MKQLSFQDGTAYDGNTVDTDTSKDAYVWHPSGKPFTIKLDFAVIDRLNVDVMKGFGAVRRRGTEVGGILLGRIDVAGDRVTVTIEDYEPVACEYAQGPSYNLSSDDMQRFRKAPAE